MWHLKLIQQKGTVFFFFFFVSYDAIQPLAGTDTSAF